MKYNIYLYTVGNKKTKDGIVKRLAENLTKIEKDDFMNSEVYKKKKSNFEERGIEVYIDAVPINSLADKDFNNSINK